MNGEALEKAASLASARPTDDRMGPLEWRVYKREWRTAFRFRRYAAHIDAERRYALIPYEAGHGSASRVIGGFEALRRIADNLDYDMEEDVEELPIPRRTRDRGLRPVAAADIAAALIFARLFDERPQVLDMLRASAPVIIIDVGEPEMFERLKIVWRDTLLTASARVMNLGNHHGGRDSHDIIFMSAEEPAKGKQAVGRERESLWALQLGLPFIAMTPLAQTHLPETILKAAQVRLEIPRLDPATIARTIRLATGRRCRDVLDGAVAQKLSLADLTVAIRFDRTPAQCMGGLRRLAEAQTKKKTGREIGLGELHGMKEAVAWAHSAIRDLGAWRRGEIPWSSCEHAACLVGPPGTGKTLFASAFARAAGVEMVACSLAAWQGADDGHLGHLLRAMKKDFDKARVQAPCVLFIDEIDSFADRSKVRHAHADYVV